jgi:hypothetical protein
MGQTVRDGKALKVPVTVEMIDPLSRLSKAALEYWVGDPGQPRPGGGKPPVPRPGDAPRQKIDLKYGGGIARGEVTLPEVPPGKVLWTQASFVNGAGKTSWATANPWTPTPPVEPRPINLTLRSQKGGQLIDLLIHSKMKGQKPGEPEFAARIQIRTRMSEGLTDYNARQKWASLRMRYLRYELGVPAKLLTPDRQERLKRMVRQLSRVSTDQEVDAKGELVNNLLNLEDVPPLERRDVQHLHQEMEESLEMLRVPVPNRVVQVGEQWKSTRGVTVLVDDLRELAEMDMIYTYEGWRKRNGRQEAVIAVSGLARGQAGDELKVSGKIAGTAYFDVESGQVALAEVAAKVEMALGETARGEVELESRLERFVGSEVLAQSGELARSDPLDARGCHFKVYNIKMAAGKKYTISLESPKGPQFVNTFLRVQDSSGKVLAEDDDSGVDQNALLLFTPDREDTFQIVVTSSAPNAIGRYTLIVRE